MNGNEPRDRAAVPAVRVAPLRPGDRPWARQLLAARWGSPWIATRGRLIDAGELPGFVAVEPGAAGAAGVGARDATALHAPATGPLGLATYRIDGDECELVSLDSLAEGRGVGTALLLAVRDAAAAAGCRRLWLVTMNANLAALGFYQRRGLRLAAIHRDALEVSRRLKPTIPLAEDGIPLRDEIELELPLAGAAAAGAAAAGDEEAAAPPGPANVEIKARARDPRELARRAEALAGGPPAVLLQEDTFFSVPAGRLKLRRLGPGGRDGAELIQYRRADRAGPRPSRYLVAPVTEADLLRRVLARALGEIGTVRKRRRLYLCGRTRIHLDEVDGLGSFLELEVVLQPGDGVEEGRAEAERLMSALGVEAADLVPTAYLDLLRAAGGRPPERLGSGPVGPSGSPPAGD